MRHHEVMRRTVPMLLALGALAAGCSGGSEREPSTSAAPPPARDEAVVETTRTVETKAPPAKKVVKRAPKAAAKTPRPAPEPAPREKPTRVTVTPEKAPVLRCPTATTRWLGGSGIAAVLRHPAPVHVSPGGPVRTTFELRNANRVPTSFRVLSATVGPDCQTPWYRVQLPIRPNGSTAWVRATAVRRYRVEYRIVVDLSDRRITVFRGGEILLRTRTAVGRSQTPTPTGSFYVNQRLLAPDPAGPWGPGGIGISAFSPVLTGWAQGGPIGIHGTNQPHTIGLAASNGCLRIPNTILSKLIYVIPDGTPVRIRA